MATHRKHEPGPMPHTHASHLLNPIRSLALSPRGLVQRLCLEPSENRYCWHYCGDYGDKRQRKNRKTHHSCDHRLATIWRMIVQCMVSNKASRRSRSS